MCGRRSRARCCGGAMAYHDDGHPVGFGMTQCSTCGGYYQRRRGPISGLVGLAIAAGTTAINNMNENKQMQAPKHATRGVNEQVPVYYNTMPTHHVHDEKEVMSSDPPMYTEEDMYQRVLQQQPVRDLTMRQSQTLPQKTRTTPASFTEAQANNPTIQLALEVFTVQLNAYQNGSAKKKGVKRARKDLMNEIYDAEVERRKPHSVDGLKCGEKSEVWREVKAYGNQLWDMIDNAKRTRRYQ